MARELDIVIEAHTSQAEAALERTEQALQNVEKAAQQVDKPISALEQHLPDVAKQFADMRAQIERTEQTLKKKKEALDKVNPAVGELTNLVRQYAAPAAIGLAIKQTLAYADSIDDLSKKTGIAPGKLQALEFSAKQVGLSIDPLARAIAQMGDRLASGDKSAIAAIDRLGLSFKNIRSMNPDAAFVEIAKAIGAVEDPMQRAADATDLFGRIGIELLPLLTEDIDALMKKAKELGLVMDDETTKAAAALNDQFSNLLDVGKRVIMVFFAPLIPILNALLTPLTYVTAELGKMVNTILSPLAQMREFAELLGVISTRLPNVPKGPGATFLPESLATMGVPSDAELGGLFPRAGRPSAGGRASNVLPFVRSFNNSLSGSPFRAYDSPALWSPVTAGFPGWYQAPLASSPFGPMAPYAGTVPMNRPTLGGSWLSGAGGRMLGAGLGMATQFMPGMNQQGSMIGSSVGGALSSLKSVSGALGSFAPFLGPIMGIAGGLIGKLFGPSEADKARDARNSFVGDFGGMGSLQAAASSAGVSLDGLMSAKKVADVEKEVRKLTEAMTAYDKKIQDANASWQELTDQATAMGRDLADSTNVNFKVMQEAAQKYGIDLNSLGDKFQGARISDAAKTIINDFELLTSGGASVGGVLVGMKDEISALVNDSLKFGVAIPANMQPWIEELLRTQQLTDENGNALTDLSKLQFADPIVTEFDKLVKKMDELISSMQGFTYSATTGFTAAKNAANDYAQTVIGLPDAGVSEGYSRGGFVGQPKYLAGGGFIPRGTDTVPAMLTPGEGVMRKAAVDRLMRGDWPQGGSSMRIDSITINLDDSSLDERRIGRALVSAIRKKRRLNAA